MRLSFSTSILTLLFASACSQDPEISAEKVYVHAMDQAATTTDPALAATIYDSFLVKNIYDTLYRYQYLARPYQLTPNLALGMPELSDDKRSYTITLKPGVLFQDHPAFASEQDREVTAEDVIFSIKRHFHPDTHSQGAWLWRDKIVGLSQWQQAGSDYQKEVLGLTALDRYTLRIQLHQPYPQLPYTLATAFSAIVPAEVVAAHPDSIAQNPIGSGPFFLQSLDSAKAVLLPNPDFRKEPVNLEAEGFDAARHSDLGLEKIAGRSPPFLDRLEIHFVQENASRWAALRSGRDIHYAIVPNAVLDTVLIDKTTPQPALKPELASQFHGRMSIEAAVLYQAFNFADPRIGYNPDPERERRNKALRCAIIEGFDWRAHNRVFYNGIARVYPGIIPPMVPEFDTTLSRDSVTRDVAAAKQRLLNAGWNKDNLPQLTFGVPAGLTQQQIYQQFRAFMVDIGYPGEKIVLRQFPNFGALNQAWKARELPIVNKGWGLDYPDAHNVLQLFYGPHQTPGANDGNFDNAEYNRLFEAAARLPESEERTAIYRQLNRIIVDECAAITGLSRSRLMLWDKNAIAFPDRMMNGGFYLRFVDMVAPE